MSCPRRQARTRAIRCRFITRYMKGKSKGKLGANAMKRVAAGDHFPIPWLGIFEPAKRPDDRVDYCLN